MDSLHLVFMDGASLHVGTFRKENWYFICTAVSVSVHFLKHLPRLGLKLLFHPDNRYYVRCVDIISCLSPGC